MLSLRMVSGSGVVAAVGAGAGCPRRVLVVVMGMGEALVDGKSFRFSAGSVFLLGPGAAFSISHGEVLVGHLLCMDADYLDYFLLQYPLGRGLGLFGGLVHIDVDQGQFVLVQERLRVLGAEVERGAGFEHLKLLFSLFLLDLVQDRFVVAVPLEGDSGLLDEFRELLEDSFRSSRATAFYARRLGVSPRRLNALCKGWYGGKGLFEVVMDRLISEAEYMLLGSDEPIKAIAYGLGFSSGENLAMYFRRMRGVSPLEFRLAGRKEG